MANEVPLQCSLKNKGIIFYKLEICVPSVNIKNKIEYFFIDGTDFNLIVDLIDCNRPLNIQWKTTLSNEILKFNNKSLFISSDYIKIPKNHTIEVILFNENKTEKLSSDLLNIEFMTVI